MSYNPVLYDQWTCTFDSDIEWYCRLAKESGGPVLELGAGTGRVVIPMASRGFEVDGLDLDPGMLEQFRLRLVTEPKATQHRVRVIEGDMRHFDLNRSYALVQIPFRGFQHNLTRED
jgi:ubiquinone/menaquinone biosynthesis C-methylase UbiE